MPTFFDSAQQISHGFYNPAPDNMIWGQLRPHMHLGPLLLKAFEKVPRSAFVPPTYREYCWCDADIPLSSISEETKFLLAPSTLGKILSQINFEDLFQREGQVLIVSGGTGYSAALFGEMGINCQVIETQPDLIVQAQENLKLYPSVFIYERDRQQDTPPPLESFFDVIFIDGGAIQTFPRHFLKYLTPTGYMLALSAQNDSLFSNGSVCQGVKIFADQTQSILFDASGSLNSEFKAPTEFEF